MPVAGGVGCPDWFSRLRDGERIFPTDFVDPEDPVVKKRIEEAAEKKKESGGRGGDGDADGGCGGGGGGGASSTALVVLAGGEGGATASTASASASPAPAPAAPLPPVLLIDRCTDDDGKDPHGLFDDRDSDSSFPMMARKLRIARARGARLLLVANTDETPGNERKVLELVGWVFLGSIWFGLVGWLIGWLVGGLVGWLACWLAGWLAGWFCVRVRVHVRARARMRCVCVFVFVCTCVC